MSPTTIDIYNESVITESYLTYLQFPFNIDQLLKEIEMLDEGIIEKIETSFTKNKKYIKRFLKDQGININKATMGTSKYKQKITTAYKKGVSPEKVAKDIVRDLIKDIVKYVKEASVPKKLFIATIFFLVVMQLESICLIFLSTFLGAVGPEHVQRLLLIVIAPLIEEGVKAFGIAKKYPWIMTGVFAGLESVKNIFQLVMVGASPTRMILIRAITIVMHFSTMLIQKHFKEKDMALVGFIAAFLIHAIFNMLAIATSEYQMSFIMAK